jgi:hypothetical protein
VLVAVGSIKGAGATTLAVALAARWPRPDAVVVEADPGGGDLAFRFQQHREPGLAELAADARPGGDTGDFATYTQRLALGVDVVFGPAAPAAPHSASVVTAIAGGKGWDLIAAAARTRLVVVDVGRLDWRSPALGLACAADLLLLVTRATLDGLDAVQTRRDALLALPGRRASIRLVLAAPLSSPADEVARVVGLPVAAVLPHDRRGAAVLSGMSPARWGWTRLELPRAARALALSLYAQAQDVEQVAWLAGLHAVPSVISRTGSDHHG